jgi:5-methylcytosine-specific restriction protein A
MTDVGTTPRARLSTRDRLAVWEAHAGRCCICAAKIDGVRERWLVEHVRALELGGADDRSNMAPAHEHCARTIKTPDDHRRAAKAKRVKARHLGVKQSAHPLPGSRASGWKRKFDGSWERRDDR